VPPVSAAAFQVMFVLLIPARAPRSFAGFGGCLPGGVEALPGEDAQARTGQLREVQSALLGREYLESRRLARWPLGRVRFPAAPGEDGPGHADVFLVTHTAGAALWECWIPAAAQPLDAARWIGWLRPDTAGSPAAVLYERLTAASGQVQVPPGAADVFPFTIVRSPGGDPPLPALIAGLGPGLVRLLYLDRSSLPFKPEVTAAELRRDFCLRDGGISLLAQRSALDLRTGEQMPAGPGGPLVLPPRSALPLLITIELLLIEREVLRLFHGKLSQAGVTASLPGLLALKAELLDGLEEYRGTVAESNRFSGEVTAYGQQALGLDTLHQALATRLDSLTFEITTSYQRTTNVLQFSLTVVIGALQAASVAAVIAAAYYARDLPPVIAWAAGAGVAAASAISVLLWRRLR
jgi:hypothetical protein